MKRYDTTIIALLSLLIISWVIRTGKDINHLSQQITEQQQSMEMQISEIWLNEPKCYFDDKTWFGWTNIPCPSTEELK